MQAHRRLLLCLRPSFRAAAHNHSRRAFSRRARDAEILSEAVAALDGNPLRLTSTGASADGRARALTRQQLELLAGLTTAELRAAAEASRQRGDSGDASSGTPSGSGPLEWVSAAVLRELADNLKTGATLPRDETRAAEVWAVGEAVFDDLSASFSLAVAQFTGRGTDDQDWEARIGHAPAPPGGDNDGGSSSSSSSSSASLLETLQRGPEAARVRIEFLANARAHAPSQYALAKILADGLQQEEEEEGEDAAPDDGEGTAAPGDDKSPADDGSDIGGGRRRRGSSHPDAVLALELYMKAARGAVLPALNNAAVMLAAGDGCEDGEPNERLARRYLEAAAEMGDPRAMVTLATWCRIGRGLGTGDEGGGGAVEHEDEEGAFRWHLEAAKFGVAQAQYATGHHYLTGKGIGGNGEPDHAQAAEWFRLAAERGVAEAAVNLAEMCRLGLGMPRGEPRPDEARRWLGRAEALGNHFASDLLEDGAELGAGSLASAK